MSLAWSKPSDLPPDPPRDQSILIRGVSWKDYVILREALDTPGLRMTYCEGVLEITTRSRRHEERKAMFARLVELYAFLRRLPLYAYGSMTFRDEAKERGVEPDECWCVRAPMPQGDVPDIVLEVIQSSPILDKLHVYDGLGAREV
jgi:Uma2 family endonuclease